MPVEPAEILAQNGRVHGRRPLAFDASACVTHRQEGLDELPCQPLAWNIGEAQSPLPVRELDVQSQRNVGDVGSHQAALSVSESSISSMTSAYRRTESIACKYTCVVATDECPIRSRNVSRGSWLRQYGAHVS